MNTARQITSLAPLRDYQAEAVDAVRSAWRRGIHGAVVALPTGVGKTRIAVGVAEAELQPTPLNQNGYYAASSRYLFLAHREELVQQMASALRRAGFTSVGVATGASVALDDLITDWQGAVRRPRQHLVTTVQWLCAGDHLQQVGLFKRIIIDEAHHATAPTYQRIIVAMRERAAVSVLGLTATVRRADGEPLAQVFDEIVYHRSISWFVAHGYLVPASGLRIECDVDLSHARVSGETGEFVADDALLSALDASNWLEVVTDAFLDHAQQRRTIAFCASVAQSQQLAAALCARGVSAEHLDGKTPMAERRMLLDDYRAGRLQVLCNVNVLSEGFDAPETECVLMARPTRSQLLYIQCVGRALRPAPRIAKRDALVLDFTTPHAGEHTLVQLADLDSDLDERRLRQEFDELTAPPGWSADFYDAVFLSIAQRRAILHFTAGNAYTRALELLRHPALAWTAFGANAALTIGDGGALIVLAPACAGAVRGALGPRLRRAAAEQFYTLLLVTSNTSKGTKAATGVKLLATAPADEIVEIASDYAEGVATRLSDVRARWRREPPSPSQMQVATATYGLDSARLEGLNRGQVSSVLGYLAACRQIGIEP